MGSSGRKWPRQYKKDSRFVADLYTFTYDQDFESVSQKKKDKFKKFRKMFHIVLLFSLFCD